MKIGVTVLSQEGVGYWNNGIRQNALFLAMLLKHIPGVTDVYMLETGVALGDGGREYLHALDLRYVQPADVMDEVDLIIEMVGVLDHRLKRLMRARGKKTVYYCCGNPIGQIERTLFDVQGSEPELGPLDEIWMLPEHAFALPMLQVMHRVPIRIVPYLWSPFVLEQRIQQIESVGSQFGYRGRRMVESDRGFRMAILEPNISVLKTAIVPMLACDHAYRQRKSEPAVGSSNYVEFMSVLCSIQTVEHKTMLYLANALDLTRDHKVTYIGRYDTAWFLTAQANAVVSHQWKNNQNYSYCDALYGNYPLIHNSEWLYDEFGAGYYYPDFESSIAGRQIIHAWETHDENLDVYQAKSRKLFNAVSPENSENIAFYAELIQQILHS
jgi:hypothetical protein